MRFRLGTMGTQQTAADGIGRGFQALFSAPLLAAQAAEEGQKARADMALRAAQTGLYQAQADEKRDALHRSSVPELLKSAALQHGVAPHQLEEFSGYATTGQLPGQYVTPADGVGPTLPRPTYADPDVGRRIFQTLGLTQNALAQGDKSVENVAKAAGLYQDQGIERQALDAAARGDDMGMSRLNTIRGKKEFTPFAAVGNTGTALNQITGAQPVTNQAINALFNRGEEAEIRRRTAAAGASDASAAKTRQEIELGSKGVLQQTDQGLLLVNPRTASAVPVVGPNGQPAGKPGGEGMSEGERKTGALLMRLRGSQQQLADAIAESPGAVKPKTTAEIIRGIPLIGEIAANGITPQARQRVEAAQLDMLDAALTLGTGAAYTREQLVGYAKSYFPQINDDKKTIADKRVRLANIIRAAEIAAGRAAQKAMPVVPKPEGAPVAAQTGGATGNWGDPAPAAAGWSITRVN